MINDRATTKHKIFQSIYKQHYIKLVVPLVRPHEGPRPPTFLRCRGNAHEIALISPLPHTYISQSKHLSKSNLFFTKTFEQICTPDEYALKHKISTQCMLTQGLSHNSPIPSKGSPTSTRLIHEKVGKPSDETGKLYDKPGEARFIVMIIVDG